MMSYLQVLPASTAAPTGINFSSASDGNSISKNALIIIVVLAGVAGLLLIALIVAGCKLVGTRPLVTTRGPIEADDCFINL